jgi:polysaccharide biosynthesis/export protein VpsN
VLLLWLVAAGVVCGSASAQAPEPGAAAGTVVDESYRLNAGDEISVQVYGEAELSKQYAIGANGMISFPFLGEVPVAGMTSREIGVKLSDALRGTYLIDPKVTVTVIRYLPIYLNGQVKTPGALPYQPGLTVRKAISLAGGLTDRASSRRIFLIPAGEREGNKPRKVRMDQIIRPGDTITVEESFF